MLSLRLQRIGKKGQPSYRLVVAPGRSKLIAPPTEDLGSYNPRTKQANIKADRVQYWLGHGAQATDTAHNLLVRQGVISVPKRRIKMAKPAVKEAAAEVPADKPVEEAAAPSEEAPATEEVVAEEPKSE